MNSSLCILAAPPTRLRLRLLRGAEHCGEDQNVRRCMGFLGVSLPPCCITMRAILCCFFCVNHCSGGAGFSFSALAATRRCRAAGDLPTVAILFAAFNERKRLIEAKLRNSACCATQAMLEVLLGLDGSTDASAERARNALIPGLHILNSRCGAENSSASRSRAAHRGGSAALYRRQHDSGLRVLI